MKKRTLTLVFCLFISVYAFSQQPIPDIITPSNSNIELDSTITEVEELEVDSLKSTDESIYKNIWNCTQIKYPANTLPKKDDLVTICLFGKHDHAFVAPVKGQILSKYGPRHRRMHTGTDIRLNSGDTVRSAFDGRVRLAKRFSGYGNLVLVRHNNGLETIYAHLKAIKVKVNDSIKAGDLVGLGGRTGRATCNHLHFETRLFGEPFDSNKYIDYNTFTLLTDKIYYRNGRFEIDPNNFNNKPIEEDYPVMASHKASAKGSAKAAGKHVIRNGDNLSTIARRYNTTVKKICAKNNITAQKTLKVGSVLRVN